MSHRRPFLFAILLSGICCLFQPPTPAAEPVAQNTTFDVDTNASCVFVKVTAATLLGHTHCIEGRLKSGKLTFGTTGQFVFDMTSFVADTPNARTHAGLKKDSPSAADAQKVTQNMLGPDVLNAAHFATATFNLTALAPLDQQPPGTPGMYQLDGSFTLHGVTQKIRFHAKLAPPEKTGPMTLTGTFSIKQSDYAIKPFSALAGLVRVADELQITGILSLTPTAK